jgi:hypothetical protein
MPLMNDDLSLSEADADAAPPAAPSRPGVAAVPAPAKMSPDTLLDGWETLCRKLSSLLRAEEPGDAWRAQLQGFATQVRELAAHDVDVALYYLVFSAGQELDHYSAVHGMACAVIGELIGRWHGWGDDDVRTLVHAALSMNVSMTRTQDALAQQTQAPNERQRSEIAGHAEASAAFLVAAGVEDALWVDVVRQHGVGCDDGEIDAMSPASRLAELLRRIDVYTAKLSRRQSRSATTPALAARDACLGRSGHPDSVGATLLRVLGLYPPGTWVSLSNGESGIVIARGAKAHTPIVAALRRADGGLLMQPVRRDTHLRGCAVVRGLTSRDVQVRVHHLRTLRC